MIEGIFCTTGTFGVSTISPLMVNPLYEGISIMPLPSSISSSSCHHQPQPPPHHQPPPQPSDVVIVSPAPKSDAIPPRESKICPKVCHPANNILCKYVGR